VIKHAYEWPRNSDGQLALRCLRLAAFREYQKKLVVPDEIDWMANAEIKVGGQILLGGNCAAHAELFDEVDGPIRHLEAF
jgi:hypothetical protein